MRARGLGLLEVVISAGVLFSVMLLLLNLATTSLWGTKEGGEHLAAEARAQSLLEVYRRKPFSSYPVGQPQAMPDHLEDGTTYQSTLIASPVDGLSPSTLRCLTVTVRWPSQRGQQEIELSTYANPLAQ